MPIQPNFLDQYIPGFSANTGAASGNIGQLLSGMPSTAPSRRKAAYFGATSGMPNSGVSNALGYDLYGQEAEANKQQGFDNLLKMLTSYSGTVAPTTGQVQQEQQYNSDRALSENNRIRAEQEAQRRLDDAASEKRGMRKLGADAAWWQAPARSPQPIMGF